MHGALRNITMCVGTLAAGALCAFAIPFVLSPTGDVGPSLLQVEAPVFALIVVLVCFAFTVGVGAVVGRLINAASGLFVVGAGLAVLSYRFATVEALAFSPNTSLGILALETAIWAVLLAGAAAAVFAVAGPLPDVEPSEDEGPPAVRALVQAAAGLLVVPVVWILCRSPISGQVFMAVVVGGIAAGMAGRLLWPRTQPILLFAAPCLFGAVGHVVAEVLRSEPLDTAFASGSLSPLAFPMPIDFAAGSLIGVSIGLGWARSFLHPEHADDKAAKTA